MSYLIVKKGIVKRGSVEYYKGWSGWSGYNNWSVLKSDAKTYRDEYSAAKDIEQIRLTLQKNIDRRDYSVEIERNF